MELPYWDIGILQVTTIETDGGTFVSPLALTDYALTIYIQVVLYGYYWGLLEDYRWYYRVSSRRTRTHVCNIQIVLGDQRGTLEALLGY